MKPIHSGTTKGRIIRTAFLAAMMCGYSAWSFWDGYVAYPRQNVVSFMEHMLGIDPPDPLPVIDSNLTAQSVDGISSLDSLEEVTAQLGNEPLRHEAKAYYFGPAGHLELALLAGKIVEPRWVSGPTRFATDLRWQKMFGWVLLPLGLAFAVQLVRVLILRVSLSDAGLRVGRRSPIPLAAMTGFGADEYERTGCVDLLYEDRGRDRTIRLDNYVIKEFRAIVEAICEARGFPNPLQNGASGASIGSDTSEKEVPGDV